MIPHHAEAGGDAHGAATRRGELCIAHAARESKMENPRAQSLGAH